MVGGYKYWWLDTCLRYDCVIMVLALTMLIYHPTWNFVIEMCELLWIKTVCTGHNMQCHHVFPELAP
jgi:hypothetical protein